MKLTFLYDTLKEQIDMKPYLSQCSFRILMDYAVIAWAPFY